MTERKQYRLLNRDGSFNIIREGGKRQPARDLYHTLLRVGPWHFLLVVVGFYFFVNVVFALAYALCGSGTIEGASEGGFLQRLPDCFFFSVQTFATIGYGRLTPHGLLANWIVTIEALIGLLAVAILTGLVFSRFSRATARVIFSRIAVVTRHEKVPSLVFRLANERLNQIMEAKVTVTLAVDERTSEGEFYRNFYELELERTTTPIFAMSWTIVHPITGNSRLQGLSQDDLIRANAEIFVYFSGIDETFSQWIHARYSYAAQDLVWDRQFEDMLERAPDQQMIVHLEKIHLLRED